MEKTYKRLANSLRSYIRDAYPDPNDAKAAYDSAGFGRYESATNYDWDAVNAFMAAAIAFVEANSALLESNFNMPNTFVTDLKNFRDAFEPQVDLFLNTLENSEIGTQDKIQFNN